MRAMPWPEFDSHVERELGVVGQVANESRQLCVHLERDSQCASCVVIMADGCSEQGHERVARELLDVASVTSHDTAQTGDDGVDHLEQLLRIEPIG